MDKNTNVNVAQIGIGYWGPNLLRNLVENKGCAVEVVVDVSPQRREFVKGLYPSILTSNKVEDVFKNPNIDGIVIATPVATHFDLTIRALNAGKHVLVEKPMATTVEEVTEIGRIAKKKNLVVMVGHTFLYNAAVRYVKELIDTGDMGQLRYIYSQRLNLGRIRSDVDALWNLAPHDISIIQYWLDNPTPESISRNGMAYIQKNREDVVFLNIAYPNRILANIHVSWLDPQKVRKMTVVGSDKMIVYDDIAESKVAIFDKGIDRMATLGDDMTFDEPNLFKFNHRSGDVYLPKIKFEEPLKVEINHFLECIRNDIDCITGVDHAREVVRILASAGGRP